MPTLRSALRPDDADLVERALTVAGRGTEGLDAEVASLSADDLNGLREAVTELLLAEGVVVTDNSHDYNALGYQCEEVIDRLAPWHWGKDVGGGA